jgi:phenylacetate-CoA ligase
VTSLKRTCYEKMPAFLKNAACLIPYRWLAGRHYSRTLDLCKRLDFASRETIERCEERQLGEVLRFATDFVPAYRPYRREVELFKANDALKSFPFLSKADILRDFERYVPSCIGAIPHRTATTGGTSGHQLAFYEDDSLYSREMAFIHQLWNRVGYSPHCRKATFRGVNINKIGPKTFWQTNPIHNEMQFSLFHMRDDTLGFYVDEICRYRPSYLHGYPSALDCLAEYVLRNGLTQRLPPIRAAFLCSEGCNPGQRRRIEEAFRTRPFSFYGLSERVILGGECEVVSVYHHSPGYGFLEMIAESGEACGVGEHGELVGTGFWNRSMPLIRYRTDDYAVREPPTCDCGRHTDRFSQVEGRRNIEGVVSRSGAVISAAALTMHGEMFDRVVRFQYYQRERGIVEIRMVVSPNYTDADGLKILQEHTCMAWDELKFVVKVVDDIPLTRLGKQRRVVSELLSPPPPS